MDGLAYNNLWDSLVIKVKYLPYFFKVLSLFCIVFCRIITNINPILLIFHLYLKFLINELMILILVSEQSEH